jgi:hypothetical protein
MTPMRRPLFLPAAVLMTGLLLAATALAQPEPRVARWVEGVILGPEFGGAGKVCSRWVRSPTLSVFGAKAPQKEILERTVEQLNEVLAKTPIKEIRLLGDNDTSAEIRVYFAPLRQFPALAKQHGFPYVQGNWGYFWTFWNPRHEITRAYVLLATDKLTGDRLRHFALEEVTQSLGLSNDSAEFPESIFYSRGGDGGSATRLSDLDRKLIVFFYNHVAPGARAKEVRQATKKHWPAR